jgi:hypothetical protein
VIWEACRYERVDYSGRTKNHKWRPVEVSHADKSTNRDINASFQFNRKHRHLQKRGGSPGHDDTFMDHLFDVEQNDHEERGSSADSDGTVVDKMQFKASRRAWKLHTQQSDGRFLHHASVDDSNLTITEGEELLLTRGPRLSESQNIRSKHLEMNEKLVSYNLQRNQSELKISAPVLSKKSIPTSYSNMNRRVSASNENENSNPRHQIETKSPNGHNGKKKYLLRPSMERNSPRIIGALKNDQNRKNSPNSGAKKNLKQIETSMMRDRATTTEPIGLSNSIRRRPEKLEMRQGAER